MAGRAAFGAAALAVGLAAGAAGVSLAGDGSGEGVAAAGAQASGHFAYVEGTDLSGILAARHREGRPRVRLYVSLSGVPDGTSNTYLLAATGRSCSRVEQNGVVDAADYVVWRSRVTPTGEAIVSDKATPKLLRQFARARFAGVYTRESGEVVNVACGRLHGGG
jgi:hypothetical protein